ncbi:cell division protein SepF [Sciscionella marina]|uniref:cell division protein SepF n=1 Tax=Sciscionella marina TaxID=508770 RepID=UPI00036503F2|nr:cell division protein SepF [Sciscionella marina]
MSTLRKLKAYFGMIPADEVDDYSDEFAHDYRDRRAPVDRYHHEFRDDYEDDYEPVRPAPRPWESAAASRTPVRGSLAMEPQPEPVPRIRAVPAAPPVPEELPLSKITTVHLHSYNEARKIGEPYRDGTPVIMNCTEMEDADARRLVDFAVGLAFAMRGDIDKITSKVFLLSPPNIDVTAEDKRRIAEGGYFGRR